MPDLYLRIAEQPDHVLDAVASSLDKRAGEQAMRDICNAYMSELPRPGAEVLEIGCGNGASTALLVENLQPHRVVAIDPAEGLLKRARERFSGRDDVQFMVGDAFASGQEDATFDVVVAHTVYSHISNHEQALAEVFRVLRPGGCLAVFDGDYATNTVALFDGDPLQAAMTAAQRHLIHDLHIMRRLPKLLKAAGFNLRKTMAHGYVQTTEADYLESLIGRGLDGAVMAEECGTDLAAALKAECRRRIEAGTFYGAILFVSMIAEKPR